MIYRILFLTFFTVLLLTVSTAAQEAATQKIVGDWQGVLDAGAVKLRIVLHFKTQNNSLLGDMDSPDQGANGIPIDSVAFENSTLKFVMSRLGASYEGTLKGEEIIGNFSQGGAVLPLTLKRGIPAPPKNFVVKIFCVKSGPVKV